MSQEITIGGASVALEQVEVDLDYADILENLEDTITCKVSEQIGDEAWDAVCTEVQDAAYEAASDYVSNHDISSGVSESDLEDLLKQLATRLENGEDLCSLGRAAQKAVTLVVQNIENPHEQTQQQLAEVSQLVDYQLKARVDHLETQVNVLLDAAQQGGERASAVDHRDSR
jgi:hypothetical protein